MEKEVGNGCSSLAYKLLFSCPFGLSQPQFSMNHTIEFLIQTRIWRIPFLRYGIRGFRKMDLYSMARNLGTFVGTNLNPSWEKFLVASEDDPTQCQHTSSPLGNGAIVETSDQKIVLLQRSDNVGEFPGHFVFPGGHPEPQEVGIETHEYCKGSKDSELVNKKVLQEMFESIIREVVEEIGVPATSLSDPLFIGISRRVLNVRPAIFFFIKCSLESKEIHQLYSKAQDGYESTQLYTVSMIEVEHMTLKMPGCHQGGFALYKLMVEALKKN
ncbi:nudix hydrolase 9 isoform X4 [Gossypium arboreum]|uniref:nudix hydrolase 9 isoform X4 n=1 Tax=Gossypium arboreum TaxID=29729 RepID=UPI0008191B75|nr:nudix hydrolase 9 isoform X4 [Gossypium arboreum]